MESNYRKYSTNLEQVRIDQQLDAQRMSNISVVQPASFEPRPVSPKKAMTLLLGFFAGVLGGLALPLAIDQYERTMRPPESDDDVGDLDSHDDHKVPMLAAIPQLRPR